MSEIAPEKTDIVLEVAAGTCACGRAIAPYAAKVTCLDMTAMLSVGKEAAEKEHIGNIGFIIDDAAAMQRSCRLPTIALILSSPDWHSTISPI